MRFGIVDRGFVREGFIADLAIVDLEAGQTIEAEGILYKCGWSPLQGIALGSKVMMTILGGEIVFRDGRVADRPRGQALQFSEAGG